MGIGAPLLRRPQLRADAAAWATPLRRRISNAEKVSSAAAAVSLH
jgi:hypothetical protein